MNGRSRRLSLLAGLALVPASTWLNARAPSLPARDASANRAPAAASSRTTWDSVFTAEQAERGRAAYGRQCARCHTATLTGADEASPLAGGAFLSNWNGETLHSLHDRILTSMPTDTPGVYLRPEVDDVVAYVLSFNGYPAGERELPTTDDSLASITIVTTRP